MALLSKSDCGQIYSFSTSFNFYRHSLMAKPVIRLSADTLIQASIFCCGIELKSNSGMFENKRTNTGITDAGVNGRIRGAIISK